MSAILRIAKTYPLRFGMGYSLMKTSGCDLLVQYGLEKREKIDWKRNIAFGTFGLFYLGGVQYMIYVPLFSRLFPNAAAFSGKTIAEKLKDPKGIRDLFSQVFLDQGVHHPLMYFPVFYMVKDFCTSDTPNPVAAVTEYTKNVTEDLTALWKVWIPSTFINFAFMPMWARIPWVATTSLVWTCILSAMRGATSDVPVEEGKFVGQVDAQALQLFQSAVLGPAPRLNPEKAHLLVTAVGPDKPGIIREIASKLYDQDASITTSKMMCLGEEFSIVLHVECDEGKLEKVRGSLATCEPSIDVGVRMVQPLGNAGKRVPAFAGHVSLSGVDRPGLLFRLSDVLSKHGLNIEHLQTEQHRTPMGKQGSGQARYFSTHCHVCGHTKPDMDKLRAELVKLEKELDVLCKLTVSDARLHRAVTG